MGYTVETVEGIDLVLGDQVKILDGPYGWATVVKIAPYNDELTLHRVYVQVGDFEYSAGVLSYIGSEEFKVIMSGRSYHVDGANHRHMTGVGMIK